MSIAILAGGQSRRMGEDKALLRPVAGGPSLIERVAHRVEGLSDDLIIVAPPDRGYGHLLPAWRIVPDAIADAGPAGGVMTAIRAAADEHVLVLPCDAPFLSIVLVRFLLERADGNRPLIPWRLGVTRQGTGRTLEVLHGVYPCSVLPRLEALIESGGRQLFQIVQTLDPIVIGPEVLTRFDPGLRTFYSLNAPADFTGLDPQLFAVGERGIYCHGYAARHC